MPNYTPYNLQTFPRNSSNIEERRKVNNLHALQSLGGVPGLQARLAMLFGVNAGLQNIQLDGGDASFAAAIRHEDALEPDRNRARQILYPENEKLVDFYNNVHTPAQNAANERYQLYEFLQRLTGYPTLQLPRAPTLR